MGVIWKKNNTWHRERVQQQTMVEKGGNGGTELREEDIPGATLDGRDPNVLTIPQLKHWLQCQNAPTRGKKADLVAR